MAGQWGGRIAGNAVPGVAVPPQGNQDLSLNDAGGAGGEPAGTVCRTVPTIAGHRYKVTFLAAVVHPGSARHRRQPRYLVCVTAGTPGGDPAVFASLHATLSAGTANASFCFTATKISVAAFPCSTRRKVIDLGP